MRAGCAAWRRARRAARRTGWPARPWPGSGTSPSVASSTTPSVPSEPTISFAQIERAGRGRRTRRGCSRRRGAGPSGSGARFRPRASRPAAGTVAVALRLEESPREASRARRVTGRTARRDPSASTTSARGRDRWSCRRRPSARRWSCWPSCRRSWRGWRWTCRARSAGRAAAAAAFSSSSTMPGLDPGPRSSGFTSSTRFRYFDVSSDSPAPMAWPACDVPPPRGVIGQRCGALRRWRRRGPRECGHDDSQRLDLVDAGVGGVERARRRRIGRRPPPPRAAQQSTRRQQPPAASRLERRCHSRHARTSSLVGHASGLSTLNQIPPAGRGIPPRGVAHRSLMPYKLALRALRSGAALRQSALIQRGQATSRWPRPRSQQLCRRGPGASRRRLVGAWCAE